MTLYPGYLREQLTKIYTSHPAMPKKVTKIVNRSVPIRCFKIPLVHQTLHDTAWEDLQPQMRWYGYPEPVEYQHPQGGTYSRSRIEVCTSERELIGYLPLPSRYAAAWNQLGYTIVYELCQWQAWLAELRRPAKEKKAPHAFLRHCANNNGTRFVQHVLARRYIAEELLSHPMSNDGQDQLPIFDKYLIRDRKLY